MFDEVTEIVTELNRMFSRDCLILRPMFMMLCHKPCTHIQSENNNTVSPINASTDKKKTSLACVPHVAHFKKLRPSTSIVNPV